MGENRYGSIWSITYGGKKVKIQNSTKMTEMQRALQAAGRHKKDRVVDLGDLRKELNIQTSPVAISITDLLRDVNKKESAVPKAPRGSTPSTDSKISISEILNIVKTYAWMRKTSGGCISTM